MVQQTLTSIGFTRRDAWEIFFIGVWVGMIPTVVLVRLFVGAV